jgi:elongation factor 1 alpha-like protein
MFFCPMIFDVPTNCSESANGILTSLSVATYSATSSTLQSSKHFSATDFFCDSPWLNIPSSRKADILVEPLYPRLGLLGGAPETAGKISKLAALAAARKKEVERNDTEKIAPSRLMNKSSQAAPLKDSRSDSLTLLERLSINSKGQIRGGGGSLGKETRFASCLERGKSSLNARKLKETVEPTVRTQEGPVSSQKDGQITIHIDPCDLRAPPSMFASIIIGGTTNALLAEPSHLPNRAIDVMEIYGQDLTEPFDFTAPSPDDIVLNAQNSSKGLPAHEMRGFKFSY